MSERHLTQLLGKQAYMDGRRKLRLAAKSGSYSDLVEEASGLPHVYAVPSTMSDSERVLNDLCIRLALKVLSLQRGEG